jgi:hypothetical protein
MRDLMADIFMRHHINSNICFYPLTISYKMEFVYYAIKSKLKYLITYKNPY